MCLSSFILPDVGVNPSPTVSQGFLDKMEVQAFISCLQDETKPHADLSRSCQPSTSGSLPSGLSIGLSTFRVFICKLFVQIEHQLNIYSKDEKMSPEFSWISWRNNSYMPSLWDALSKVYPRCPEVKLHHLTLSAWATLDPDEGSPFFPFLPLIFEVQP